MAIIKLRRGGTLTTSSDDDSSEEVVRKVSPPERPRPCIRDLGIKPENGRILVVGSSGTGKTNLIRNLILHLSQDIRILATFWFGASHVEEKWLPKLRRSNTLTEERIKAMVDVMKRREMKDRYIITVLDDIAMMKSHNNKVMDLFISQASRHHRIIVICGIQKMTLISPTFRQNMDLMFCLSGSNEMISDLYKESNEHDFYRFRDKFRDLGKEKGQPLFIDRLNHTMTLVKVPQLDSL